VPLIGPDLAVWVRGDFVVGDATLNRFFAFHVIAIPLVLVGLVAAHIIALHEVGSNNPDGVEIKKNKNADGIPLDGIPFHPYYTVHDIVGIAGFLIVFCAVVFFAPELGGYFLEFNNFIPADPLVTPPHIAPVWYFTPFYSMLRAVTDLFTWVMVGAAALGALALLRSNWPMVIRAAGVAAIVVLAITFRVFDAKFWGVVIMGGAVIILFFLPWLDVSPVKSIRYRPTCQKVL
jgi:ubiquinol-cytochrome c reductase cytochrome b subunit